MAHYTHVCAIHGVSVPIRGLFNLTKRVQDLHGESSANSVSVPIRGLFNLTLKKHTNYLKEKNCQVSVPIRGLFNLTPLASAMLKKGGVAFPSPSGDYLI